MSIDADLEPAEQTAEPQLSRPRWERICPTSHLIVDRGAAALVDGYQVAIFLLADGDLHVIDDRDPFSGAAVLSRGLVGDAEGEPTVASPVYKQRFALRTGHCLDDPSMSLCTWAARVRDGCIEVAVR